MTGIHIVDAFLSFLVTICMLLTGVMDSGEATSTPEVELVREDKLLSIDAMKSGQGVEYCAFTNIGISHQPDNGCVIILDFHGTFLLF